MPFDFNQAQPLAEAIDTISGKTPVGATLKSAEWAQLPAQLRESAMFSARVESVRAMQSVKDALDSILKGDRDPVTGALKMDRSKFIETIQKTANQLGLRTQEQGKKGSIEDFGSERRLKLIYEQQIGAAQARAYWLQGMDPDVLDGWPAQELVRVADRKKKRDWKRRWLDAASAVGMQGVSASAMAAGRMIALKTSPIWAKLSRFGRPYPPFDYNSGMGVEERDREDAEKWGLLGKGERIEPNAQEYQDSLAASVQGLDDQMRAALKKIFGDQIAIEGDTAQWKPAAVKPTPAAPPTPSPTPTPPSSPTPAPTPPADKPIPSPAPAAPAAPPATAPSKPFVAQNPVSAALDVKAKAGAKRLKRIGDVIDRTHDDGRLPKIPVTGRPVKGALAHYAPIDSEIAVKVADPNAEHNYTHEIGHFLDHKGLDQPGQYASQTSPLLQGWRDAVANTPRMKQLTADFSTAQPGTRRWRILEYLLRGRETWARSYAQWLAVKSGDAVLLDQIRDMQTHRPEFTWPDAEFKPVLQAIDDLFRVKGWIP